MSRQATGRYQYLEFHSEAVIDLHSPTLPSRREWSAWQLHYTNFRLSKFFRYQMRLQSTSNGKPDSPALQVLYFPL